MATQLYDSSGLPIFSSGAVGTTDQQVSDSIGNIINPAKEDGNLLAIKTDTDKFTFTSTRLLIDGSGVTQPVSGTLAVTQSTSPWVVSGTVTVGNATLAVTQSGVWTIARSWTLASGTDSVAAVQSGTWNINNISGTISLPTGAATETTLGTRLADATFTGRINTQGQKTMSASTPVVLASDQTSIPVVGNVSSGATDLGNPVKVGGIYKASGVTLTDGQRGDVQLTSRGRVKVDDSSYFGYDNLRWDDAALAMNASVQHDTVVPNGVTWDLHEVIFGGSDLFNVNKTAGNVVVTWDATGTPKILAKDYSMLTDSSPIHYRITGNGTKILRVTVTNGNNKTSDITSRIVYSVGI